MHYDYLTEICQLKQWKTISNKELTKDGFPVYGANGVIGYYSEYNHINKTILLGCRGTCGSVHISRPYSYINGNALCLDNLSESYDINYVYYFLKSLDYSQIISGTGIPQITQNGLKNVIIPRYCYQKQVKISTELSSIDELIVRNKLLLKEIDNIVKSRFIEMFGTIDLSKQLSNWKELGLVSKIYTGTTPSTSDPKNWDGDILWITPAEMNNDTFYVYDTVRKITELGRKSKSLDLMSINTVLLSTRAPIGKVGIVGKPMACNQGFKNFECSNEVNPVFLYTLLKNNTEYLNSLGSGTTFLEVSKSKISKMLIPVPQIELQNKFASFVNLIDKSKFVVQKRIKLLNELLNKKMDEYFN